MLLLQLKEIYQRGLTSFEGLSPLERDVFAVHDANLRFEMEGNLSAFLGGSASAPVATWLEGTLRRTGDEESLNALAALSAAHGGALESTEKLSSYYYALQERRWSLLEKYLGSNHAAVGT